MVWGVEEEGGDHDQSTGELHTQAKELREVHAVAEEADDGHDHGGQPEPDRERKKNGRVDKRGQYTNPSPLGSHGAMRAAFRRLIEKTEAVGVAADKESSQCPQGQREPDCA